MAGIHRTIKVAAGQIQARLMNEASATLADLEQVVQQAAAQQVDLLVLPECAYPAYLLGSVQSYRAGDHLSSAAFVEWLCERAKCHRMHIISGIVEDNQRVLHNSAVLIDDTGREIGRSRKQFLWNVDRDWFVPGDTIQAFDTRLGRIGMAICAETRIPEILATLIADGAELIAVPTCWVNHARQPGQYANPQVEFMMEARAREFAVPFVCADKWGLELGAAGYVGQSRIIRADGSLAANAPTNADAVVTAEIDLSPPPSLSVSDVHQSRLRLTQPATRPATASNRKIRLAAAPTGVIGNDLTKEAATSFLESLRHQNVDLFVTNLVQPSQVQQLTTMAKQFGIHAVGFPTCPNVFEVGPARVGCVVGESVRSFAASRVLALDGAELLFYFDGPDDLPILQTRAAENRVFVIGVNQRSALIIEPDGKLVTQTKQDQPTAVIAEIDLAQSANKRVAPRTDIFDERRPASYRFGGDNRI